MTASTQAPPEQKSNFLSSIFGIQRGKYDFSAEMKQREQMLALETEVGKRLGDAQGLTVKLVGIVQEMKSESGQNLKDNEPLSEKQHKILSDYIDTNILPILTMLNRSRLDINHFFETLKDYRDGVNMKEYDGYTEASKMFDGHMKLAKEFYVNAKRPIYLVKSKVIEDFIEAMAHIQKAIDNERVLVSIERIMQTKNQAYALASQNN